MPFNPRIAKHLLGGFVERLDALGASPPEVIATLLGGAVMKAEGEGWSLPDVVTVLERAWEAQQ